MNPILSFILKEVGPYLLAFALGAVLFNGCGESSPVVEKATIKPESKIEYVDRWKHDTTRFTVWQEVHDTIYLHDSIIDIRLDTLLKVDTLKIVEAWLTEVAKYDTTLTFLSSDVRVKWQNYQNLTDSLQVTLTPRPNINKLGVLMFARVGTVSDFKTQYKGLVGAGLLFEKKRLMFGAQYGYSGQHHVGGMVGYRLR